MPGPTEWCRRKAISYPFLSIALTTLILVAEVVGGIWTGSLALLSDAAHVFMDVFALTLSFVALRLSALPPNDRHTYGYHRLEVLAALINGVTLGVIAIGIFWEAAARWNAPEPIKSSEMLVIAVIGLVVNLVVAFVLGGHHHEENEADHAHEQEDMNVRSAFLHVVGDAISSVGVILAAGVIWFTGWYWADPLASVVIGAIILLGSWRVLRPTLHLLMEGVPEGLDLARIEAALTALPEIRAIHDLHVWSLCAGHVALSAHMVVDDQELGRTTTLMNAIKRCLTEQFGIWHTTIQLEYTACGQGCCVHAPGEG